MRSKLIEHGLVLLVLLAAAAYYAMVQPQIQINGGYGWDGVEYQRIYQLIAGLGSEPASFPFCSRVGTAYLAVALDMDSAAQAFGVVNTVFGLVFSYAIYLIGIRAGYGRGLALTGMLISLIPFSAPLRMVPFYPVYTDPAFLALLALSFLALIHQRPAMALLLLALAYPFREVALYLAPVLLLFAIYLQGFSRRLLIAFLLAMVAMFLMKYAIGTQFGCEGGQLRTALSWLRRALTDPQRFLACVASISLTAAPIVYLARAGSWTEIEKLSVVGAAIASGLAVVGGTDTSRIFFSFFPLYVVAILGALRTMGPGFTAACMLGYVVVNRAGMRLLEPAGSMPANDLHGLFWQTPDQARPEVALMIIAVWVLVFLGFGAPRASGHAPAATSRT